jgi:hypothetical protein
LMSRERHQSGISPSRWLNLNKNYPSVPVLSMLNSPPPTRPSSRTRGRSPSHRSSRPWGGNAARIKSFRTTRSRQIPSMRTTSVEHKLIIIKMATISNYLNGNYLLNGQSAIILIETSLHAYYHKFTHY